MADRLFSGTVRATPRDVILGYLSDLAAASYSPERTQQMQGIAKLLSAPAISETLNRLSYGEPLTTGAGGLGGTTRIRPEALEAAMAVAPMVGPAGRAAGATTMAAGRAGERLAERVVPQIMQRGGMGSEMLQGMSRGTVSPMDVYHGTPHTLPPTTRNPLGEFDASKIGTGEGAQAYGYGIYTAENPAVAKEYQFMQQNWFDTGKAKYKGKSINSWYEQAQKDRERAFRTNNKALEKDAGARLAYWENIMTHNHPESVVQQFTDPAYGWPEATNYAKSIDLTKFSGIPRSGNLYKVDLPDEQIAKMLDYDKPLSQQSAEVQQALTKLGYVSDKNKIGQFDDALLAALQGGSTDLPKQPLNLTGEAIYKKLGTPQVASEKLKQLGIPGIKYLDQGSRGTGQGTRNFVTFPGEEKNMTILERNGQLPEAVRQYMANPMYSDPFADSIR